MADAAHDELMTEGMVDRFMDRWLNDPSFFELLRSDPATALRLCGIDPSDEVLARFGDLPSDLPLEELRERVSKGTSMN